MGMRRPLLFGTVAIATLGLTACIGGGPSPAQIAEEFATPIEPAWTASIPGLFGDVLIRDGVALAYADDEEVGMRLTAVDVRTGDILWEHTASPGGAYSNPLLTSVDAASRPYPLPTIAPTVIEQGDGDDARLLVVFTERDVEMESIRPDDLLRVADLRTGEPVEVTMPDADPEEFSYAPVQVRDDGEVAFNVQTPARTCSEGLCWAAEGDEIEDVGTALVTLDPASLELRYTVGYLPPSEDPLSPDHGLEYVSIATDEDFDVARYVDAVELWRVPSDELFGVERSSPPEFGAFVEVGDLVLIQGYQPMRETLDPELPHTVDLDFTTSRTLVAVDRESGEVAWRLAGGDLLCHAVHGRSIPADAETVPVCLATAGSFVYDLGADDYVDQEDLVASIVEVEVATGEIGWESEGSGVVSLAHVGRLLDLTYAARGDLTVVDRDEETGLVDLRDGAWHPVAAEDAIFVCKAERDDAELDFEGSAFASGSNPITTGYPAGWRHFPCDVEGTASAEWSTGSVRLAGYRDATAPGVVVLPTDDELIGFDLAR